MEQDCRDSERQATMLLRHIQCDVDGLAGRKGDAA